MQEGDARHGTQKGDQIFWHELVRRDWVLHENLTKQKGL